MQGADAKGERRAGTEIPADPSKLVREYGDSDLNEMIKTVNLQTSQVTESEIENREWGKRIKEK
eukprot:1279020-Amorphochlora_amoeboformis.AAC.1